MSRTQRRDERGRRLGQVIRELREQEGMSRAELSKSTGLGRSYLSYLEGGKFAQIGLDPFAKIANALRTSADYLLQEAGYRPPSENSLELRGHLKRHLGFGGASLDHVMAYLEFMAEHHRTRKAKGAV
jgi:transcriptional regulator with XRE-family HTH domain